MEAVPSPCASSRPVPFALAVTRPRSEYPRRQVKLTNRDSHEDPNIQQNDCRNFKDPNFELNRMEHDMAIQARP